MMNIGVIYAYLNILECAQQQPINDGAGKGQNEGQSSTKSPPTERPPEPAETPEDSKSETVYV
jgi:hypothetical protein